MKNLKLLITGMMVAAVCGSCVASADAGQPAPSSNFTVYPTFMHGTNKNWIVTNAAAGATLKESVTLENLSDAVQNISLQFREAEETDNGFVSVENEPYRNLGNWTALSDNTFTLEPHQKLRVPVEFKIPSETTLGKYTGVIYAVQAQRGESLNIVTRIGVRAYITVTSPFDLQTNTFENGAYRSGFFLAFSLIGVLGALLYNGIYVLETRKIKAANK